MSGLVEEARRLAAAATEGPWEPGDTGKRFLVCTADEEAVVCRCSDWEDHADDVIFIAQSRTLVPEMADRLEAAEAAMAVVWKRLLDGWGLTDDGDRWVKQTDYDRWITEPVEDSVDEFVAEHLEGT